MQIQIRRPDDWHLHLRDGAALAAVLPFTAARFARAIVMPNLKPPVTTTAAALEYRARILAALPPNDDQRARFTPLMTLYLTDRTEPAEMTRASESGVVFACKLYPAGATTNADSGVTDIRRIDATLERMSAEFEQTKAGLQHATHIYEGEGKYLGVQLGTLLEKHRAVLNSKEAGPTVAEFVTRARAIEAKYANRIVGF
jgi:dihydroorotase (homodimeric type)